MKFRRFKVKVRELVMSHLKKKEVNNYRGVRAVCLPSILNRDNPSFVLSNFLKNWLRKIKVFQWRITPSSCIIWKCIIWRAEICCSYCDCSWNTPIHIHTFYLKTSSTRYSMVEKFCAQGCCACTISLAIQIPISTCST